TQRETPGESARPPPPPPRGEPPKPRAPAAHQQPRGGVGPGKKGKDPSVTHPPHPAPQARRPTHPVIEGAGAKADSDRASENGGGSVPTAALRPHDQKRPDHQRDRKGRLMEHTP